MAALGHHELEQAAGKWLERLQCADRLPPQSTLQAMYQRERAARQRAEKLARAEAKSVAALQARLDEERGLGAQRAELLLGAQAELCSERAARREAEAGLRRTEQELLAEASAREAAERACERVGRELAELKVVLEDDRALEVLDEFKDKLEAQREEISALSERLGLAKDGAAASERELRRVRGEWEAVARAWGGEREGLLAELARIRDELAQLERAGRALQAAAEGALEACAQKSGAPPAESEAEGLAGSLLAGVEQLLGRLGQLEAVQEAAAEVLGRDLWAHLERAVSESRLAEPPPPAARGAPG